MESLGTQLQFPTTEEEIAFYRALELHDQLVHTNKAGENTNELMSEYIPLLKSMSDEDLDRFTTTVESTSATKDEEDESNNTYDFELGKDPRDEPTPKWQRDAWADQSTEHKY
jgi:hypothetical protein